MGAPADDRAIVERGRRWRVPAAFALVVFLIDAVSKALAHRWLANGHDALAHLFGVGIGFQYVENRGAAFGTFLGYGALISAVALLVMGAAIIFYVRIRRPSAWLMVAVGLLVGGALGNVVDRVSAGYVVDFIAVGPWPRFNVADSAVTIGVLLLAWRLGGLEDTGTVRGRAAQERISGVGGRDADAVDGPVGGQG